MNCPNCGGTLDINKRHCSYCDTTFTYEELHPQTAVHTKTEEKTAEEIKEPEKPKTLTEKKIEELKREKQNRPVNTADANARDIAVGATVMGVMGLFSGVRRFFRELKRTVCFILMIALEIGFGYLMISDTLKGILQNEIADFALLNFVILANALVAGLICRIGRIRAGTALIGIINFLAVAWVFVYPLIITNFEGVSAQSVAVLAVVEMAVLTLSVLFAHLIYRR